MSYFAAFIGMSIGAGLLAVTNVITGRQNKRLRREVKALSGALDLACCAIAANLSEQIEALINEDNEDTEEGAGE